MRAAQVHRETIERVLRGAMGGFPRGNRLYALTAHTAALEAASLALPVSTEGLDQESQNADGSFFFMIDLSRIDGADPIG
jgi:hypothetical protein